MRVLVVSDIHGNLHALEAVLADAGTVDGIWVLGDVVGYGPDPEACVQRLVDLQPARWLAGNHDLAAIGALDDSEFNVDARIAVRWTARQLSAASRALLGSLSARLDLAGDTFTLAHGSPRHPVWEYILDAGTAAENFHHFTSQICLFGHTHIPAVYEQAIDGARRLPLPVGVAAVPEQQRWLVNPGSVGQPRDADPRASYMLADVERPSFTLRRVVYDVGAVQARMLEYGLPRMLATRLEHGW